MIETSNKTRYNPKYKIKPQNKLLKDNTSSNLPSNLQDFKQKILSGSGFLT